MPALFDAIGTSQFGAGTDIFTNTGIVTLVQRRGGVRRRSRRSTIRGRVEMRDGAVGDTLNVTGAFIGIAAAAISASTPISAPAWPTS